MKRFISAIKQGATIESAAGFAGLSVSVIYHYLSKGRQEEKGIYKTFFDDYKRAKGSLMLKNLMIIHKAAEKDWRAAKFILECQGMVPQYKPEVEISISVDQVDTKDLIEQLKKTDDLLNLKGPIIDIEEE